MKFFFYCFITLLISKTSIGQTTIDSLLLSKPWTAEWITHPAAGLKSYEVYLFRKDITLPKVSKQFIINVSADSRYKLYVNGKFIGLGPARSDLMHWNFESYNISEYLKEGKNVIAAVVWNQGEYNGYAQHSYRTGLIIQGNSPTESVVNTNDKWKVIQNDAYAPVVFKHNDERLFWQYYVAGALDSVDAAKYPWDWQGITFDDSKWTSCKTLGKGCPSGPENTTQWTLQPRPVALLESTEQRFASLARSSGSNTSAIFPGKASSVTIPPNAKASLLLDTKFEVTGYPELTVTRGKNSKVKITYAEALLETEKDNPKKWHKGNRNQIEGKKIYGVYDVFMPDGGENRIFVPLWMRVFRFVQLDIETSDEPLVINDISYHTSMYPFQNKASFKTNDSIHQKIFDACLRTIRLASQETYIDPYYEQMQYIGDTRIEALYAYYHFDDDRLSKNAIQQFNWSRSPEGITMSRYPSDLPQYTPLYALCWMLMINDYWMLRNDEPFVKQYIPGMLDVLNWFEQKINKEEMLGDLPYLDFLDSQYDHDKILNSSKSKSLTPYSLFYVYTVQQLKPFFEHFQKGSEIEYHEKLANSVRQKVIATCYDSVKGLFAENPDKEIFSQHSNIMAVLTDCVPLEQQKILMNKILTDTSLMPVSLYFKFYQFAALKKTSLGSRILNEMGDWTTMLNNGMHTFSEWLTDPRSECHSWSAYPSYYFINTIAGIQPDAPGFKTVLIEPSLGNLKNIQASMPHPNGLITAKYQQADNAKWNIEIQLPKGIGGTLKWKGKTYIIKAGEINKWIL